MTKIIRNRNWCLTLNNYSNQEYKDLQTTPVKYMVLGKEIGEDGTPHIQGYMAFKNARTLTALKKNVNGRAHWEVAKADSELNFKYCSKENNYIEIGERPKTQKAKGEMEKNRWALIKDLAKEGKLDEIEPSVYIKYYRTLQSIAKDNAPMPSDADGETGAWYCGPSGAGKSRKAREENPGAYLKMCNKWWDGYDGEDVVIIEDFDINHKVLCYHLKIWGDRYAFPAEIKGGKINIRPKKIIVTSNYHPSEIWESERDLEPILRRFQVKEFRPQVKALKITYSQ